MQGIIHQINISQGGIPKLPIEEAKVRSGGIDGDSWAHPRIHGGPNQALLLISLEDLGALERQGFRTPPGALGENLTIIGINMREVRLGDRFRAGEVLLEITKLRKPCQTLDPIGRGITKRVVRQCFWIAEMGQRRLLCQGSSFRLNSSGRYNREGRPRCLASDGANATNLRYS